MKGWDILFEEPNYSQAWVRLARKKWYGDEDGDCQITAAEFDEILGHSVAVTDAAASVFATEMITAYPDAKVILNGRSDLDAWHASAVKNLARIKESWLLYTLSNLTRMGFWSWTVYETYLWGELFRGDPSRGIRCNGKWIYREHYNMIRGLVPKENLLEWTVGDGWEPLCKVCSGLMSMLTCIDLVQFLGKEVPNEPFPRVNDAAGFDARERQWHKKNSAALVTNLAIFCSVVAVGAAALSYRRSGRIFELTNHGVKIVKGAFQR